MNKNSSSRADKGKKAGLIGVISNVILSAAKLAVGIISASVSIIADAINNFTDAISSVVTLVGFKLSKKPADADHPFGHARYEYVSGLIVSLIILLVGFELIKSSVEKIISPTPVLFSVTTIVILSVSVLTKFALFIYNLSVCKKINSAALKAAALDSRNDAIITALVLVALVIEHFAAVSIDAYVGLAVAAFILYSGIKLVKETASPILGKCNNEKLKTAILEKLKEYPIVIGYHDLMIHDYGPGISFCSIHFEIDKNLDPLYVHELIDKFEREFLELGTNLTVHYDPVVTDSAELNQLKHLVMSALIEFDSRLIFHDFRSIPCDGFVKVFFDLPLPEDLQGDKSAIVALVNQAMNGCNSKRFQAEITFDSFAFN